MLFKEVVGQKKIKKQLIRSVEQGRVPHALMLLGPAGAGGLPLALAFAQYLSCRHRTEEDSCGTCPSCKKHRSLQFPDTHFSFPIFNKKSQGSICEEFIQPWRKALSGTPYMDSVEWRGNLVSDNKQLIITAKEAGDINKSLSLAAYEGGYKFLIMWLPEVMKPAASNKLLKAIEEPPKNTIFLLVAESQENILPTILSRTQIVRVPKLADEDIREGVITRIGVTNPEKVQNITRIAEGNFWKAQQLAKTDHQLHLESFISLMRYAYTFDMAELTLWANDVHSGGRENMKQFLEYSLHMVQQCILGNYTGSVITRMSAEEQTFAENFAKFINHNNVIEVTRAFEEAHYDVSRNIYGKLVLFDLSIQLARLLRR